MDTAEETKDDEAPPLPYDDKKVQQILKAVGGKDKCAAKTAPKKDFRAFLKQQKNLAEKEQEAK